MNKRCPSWALAGACGLVVVGLLACGGGGGGSSSQSAPTLTTQPQNQTVTAPATATFSVVAAGTTPLAYQWSLGGTAIPNATSASYTTPSTVAGSYSYTCMVTNSAGKATSQAALLTVNPATTQAVIATNRISGPAPLAVSFDGTGSSSAQTANPFRDLLYQWDFGDSANSSEPLGGTWSHGTQSQTGAWSKNQDEGPLAGHVYQTPGTYTATLSTYDGTSTSHATVVVTVQDPNAVFAPSNGGITYCVSSTAMPLASDPGVPAGAVCVKATSMDGCTGDGTPAVFSLLTAANTRILFKRGETWFTNGQSSTPVLTLSNLLVGAYGSPSASAPHFNFTTIVKSASGPQPAPFAADGFVTNGLFVFEVLHGTETIDNLTFMDLDAGLDPAVTWTASHAVSMFSLVSSNLLLLRDTCNGISSLGAFSGAAGVIQDCSANHQTGGFGHEGIWIQCGQDPAVPDNPDGATGWRLMGNQISDCVNIEHNIRTQGLARALYSHNSLSHPRPDKHLLAVRGDDSGDGHASGASVTHTIQISDNVFGLCDGNGTPGSGDLQVAPENNTSDEPIQDVIIERNLFTTPASDPTFEGSGAHIWVAVSGGLVVRNNLFYDCNASNAPSLMIQLGSGTTAYSVPPCTSAFFQNNTFYAPKPGFTTLAVFGDNLPADNNSGIVMSNNLSYDPEVTASGFGNSFVSTPTNPNPGTGLLVYWGAGSSNTSDPISAMLTNTFDVPQVPANPIMDVKSSPGWALDPDSAGLLDPTVFIPPSGSYAIGTGTFPTLSGSATSATVSPVWEDFFRKARSYPMDLGAFHH